MMNSLMLRISVLTPGIPRKSVAKNLAACVKSDIIRLRVQMTAVKQYSIFSKEETP